MNTPIQDVNTHKIPLGSEVRQTPSDSHTLNPLPVVQREHATSESPLLALPPEILQCILHPLLRSRTPLAQLEKRLRTPEDGENERYPNPWGDWHYHQAPSFNLHPQVLRVCHHLYDAGWPILYKQNSWVIDVFEGPRIPVSYLLPDPGQGGIAVYGGSPLEDDNCNHAQGAPEAVRKHMERFTFEIQFETLEYQKFSSLTNSNYFLPPNEKLTDMLSGDGVKIVFDISMPPHDDNTTAQTMDDPAVARLIHFFGSFKRIRCGSVEVFVNGSRLETQLARTMMSDDPVDEDLPVKWRTFGEYVGHLGCLQGFPGWLYQEARHAVEEWDAEKFRKLRNRVLTIVDDLLAKKREDLRKYMEVC